MSQQNVPILALPFTAVGAVAARRFTTALGAQAGDGEGAVGVSKFSAADTEDFSADILGTVIVETGGIFSAGAELQSDADGRAVVKAAGVKNARALQASTGAGQFIEALMLPN